MTNNDNILNELQQYFPGIQPASDEVPVNYVVYDEGKVNFFIVVKPSNDEEWETVIESLENYLELPQTEKLPVIVFKFSEKKQLLLGMLCYWEFDKLRWNHGINWRTLDNETIFWINTQLKARHRRIAFLPPQFMRVVKTIELNAGGYFDARIIYLRKFHGEEYRMKQHDDNIEKDRFERLLHGTPQDDYPVDKLDKLILSAIRTEYPNAANTKNKLLLFDVDLLNYRLEKINRIQPINISVQTYATVNVESFNIQLECYYQVNTFRPKVIRETVIPYITNLYDYKELREDYNTTYESLSKMNI